MRVLETVTREHGFTRPEPKTLSLIFLLIFIFSQPSISLAADQNYIQTIRVSPIILRINLSPGKTYHHIITVDNLLDTPLPIKASVEGFDASDEENGIKISNQVVTSPLIDWIKVNDTDTILPAKSSKEYELDITIPDKVDLGGYYAVIFFTPILPNINNDVPSQVGAKIGVLALASIGVDDVKNQGEIITFSFDKNLYQENPLKTTIRIQNTSLNFFSATPLLTIKPIFGKPELFQLEEKTILPGKIRRWEKTLTLNNLNGGLYTASLSVSTEKGDFIYSKKLFFAFPLTKTVITLVGLLVLLYSLIFRKRVKKAFKMLFIKKYSEN